MNALEHCKVRLPFFLYTLYNFKHALGAIIKASDSWSHTVEIKKVQLKRQILEEI